MSERTFVSPAGVAESSVNPRTDAELVRDLMETLGAILDRIAIYACMSDRDWLIKNGTVPEDPPAAPLMGQKGLLFAAQVQALLNEFNDGPQGMTENLIQFGDSLDLRGFAGHAAECARTQTVETIRALSQAGHDA